MSPVLILHDYMNSCKLVANVIGECSEE